MVRCPKCGNAALTEFGNFGGEPPRDWVEVCLRCGYRREHHEEKEVN